VLYLGVPYIALQISPAINMFKTSLAKSEFVTRKHLVDRKLKDASWRVVPFDSAKPLAAYERCAIEEYPTENGPADYALCTGSKILGVVEAKKLTLGPMNVLMQAERYSRGLLASPFNFRGFHVPFLYSTNGEVIWHHDVRHELNRSRQITGFHTPDALSEFLGRDLDAAIVLYPAPA
jgi:type I restriction enzyme R subunit